MISLMTKVVKFKSDFRGSIIPIAVVYLAAFLCCCGLVIDVSNVYNAKIMLQASSDAAALAGAQNINRGIGGQALTTAASYGSGAGQANSSTKFTAAMAPNFPSLKCLNNVGISCAGPDAANAISVKQTASVNLYFGSFLGISKWNISASSTASAKGGGQAMVDIVFVLDTTSSMNNKDTSCGPKDTRLSCALSALRSMLGLLSPCSPSLSECGVAVNGDVSTPLARVGLVVFPGFTNAAQAAFDIDCSSGTKPSIAKYSANPVYTLIPLSSDYRTSATSPLNGNSNLVKAIGGGATGCAAGLMAVGGQGTFYADAITAAQNMLTLSGRPNANKVIVFVGDGDASSSSAPTGKTSRQCYQAVSSALAAKNAGTTIYSIAYDASSSSSASCSTDSPPTSACATLQSLASGTDKFFSDKQAGCVSANLMTNLVEIFKAIGGSLSTPRLIPDGTT